MSVRAAPFSYPNGAQPTPARMVTAAVHQQQRPLDAGFDERTAENASLFDRVVSALYLTPK